MSGQPRRIQGLDLIRGFAVGLVLVRHADPARFGYAGIIGVVIFFTLSGYLITGVLVGDVISYGRIRYGHFYRNRALRLLPALLFFLVVFLVVTVWLDPLHEVHAIPRVLISALTYTADLPYDHGSDTIGHLWTLSTEEQFYLLWPVVILFAVKYRHVRGALVTAYLVFVLLCVGTLVIYRQHIETVYSLPTSWATSLIIGAAAFFGREGLSKWVPRTDRARHVLIVVTVAALVALSMLPEAKAAPLTYLVTGPVVSVLAVVLILTTSRWLRIPSTWLRPLLGLGIVSYAAYIWDLPLIVWSRPIESPTVRILMTLLAVAMAVISWYLIERPTMRWKARLDERARRPAGSELSLEPVGAIDGGRT